MGPLRIETLENQLEERSIDQGRGSRSEGLDFEEPPGSEGRILIEGTIAPREAEALRSGEEGVEELY
jgi:hypothetical protein